VEVASADVTDAFRTIVQAHCWLGLARLVLFSDDHVGEQTNPTQLARKSLRQLLSINIDQGAAEGASSWCGAAAMTPFLKSHVMTSRQLVAEALLRSGHLQEAKTFFEDAVRDAPQDADAALSLGAFLLRDALSTIEPTAVELNAAKIQLLQAARLDSRKPGPFALLGFWYENQKDLKRALGCYSKALLLDPPNPVAGRGVLRLTPWKSAKAVVDAAIQTASPVNGWAWRALGKNKVMVSGENDFGAVALLKALRCRDIDQPQSEALSPFFDIGRSEGGDIQYQGKEKAQTWSELAFCYRRIGRYTAAIRGYYSSIEAAGDYVTGEVLCACAEGKFVESTDETMSLPAYG
jgi:tetratricopeptide (TPR) repeat protein